jgi:trimethylamine--corrinoid protein Co-methyltransferase
MQKDYVYPHLGNRMSPKEWVEAGKPDLVERATARKREILSTHYPEFVSKDVDEKIRAKLDIKLPRERMQPGDPRFAR